MATYIAREDFLTDIYDIDGNVIDGAYVGQLALVRKERDDENSEKVLYCWGGNVDKWIDMTAVVADFRYCSNIEIEQLFQKDDTTDPLLAITVEPASWESYKEPNDGKVFDICKDPDDNCSLDHE